MRACCEIEKHKILSLKNCSSDQGGIEILEFHIQKMNVLNQAGAICLECKQYLIYDGIVLSKLLKGESIYTMKIEETDFGGDN